MLLILLAQLFLRMLFLPLLMRRRCGRRLWILSWWSLGASRGVVVATGGVAALITLLLSHDLLLHLPYLPLLGKERARQMGEQQQK